MKRLLLLALVGTAASAAPIDMAMFDRYDANHDGYVDLIEVMGSVDLQGRFNDIDVDTDRRLSRAEMQRWLDDPDKRTALNTAAPLDPYERWRELERRRQLAEEQRAQDALAGREPGAATSSTASAPPAADATAGPPH